MPVKAELRSGSGVVASDAKEFLMPGQIENISPRPPCTAPPCRGCKRPCARGIGEGITPIDKKVSTKK